MQHGLIAREKSFDERMWHTHKTLEKIDRFCAARAEKAHEINRLDYLKSERV